MARLVENLREADHRKDEFLATLAHELRNPLAPLRNGLQVMKLAKDDADAVEQSRTMMERQLGQMVRLIDDLLDLSRISRGKIELRKERVELAKAIQHAIETSRTLIETGSHKLTINLPARELFVEADVTRLTQVFANLLNNAAKYSDPGGQITVTVERDAEHAVARVRDTGVGIPAEKLSQVFEMFAQVDRSLQCAQDGLGIGLSLVKGLVEMHGGGVEVKSGGLGSGSEFIVRLPAASSLIEDIADKEPSEAISPLARRRILIADDNRDACAQSGDDAHDDGT